MSLNVGILGHVDSGKTTLTRAIADMASTAAFDKHAEKGGRRNTLDLGFSYVCVADRRLALVDCPGHSSLIRAVLAASSVFDMAIVVIDAANGIQPQTAEHLLLCSIFCCDHVVVALNKIDLIDEQKLPTLLGKIRKGLKSVGVNESSPIVPISLLSPTKESLRPLFETIENVIYEPVRSSSGKMVLAVDHCFPIKGKGTVMTGTVLDGCIRMNQEIEIPSLRERRKVKGLESWKEKHDEVVQGERAAVLVQSLDSESLSRTMVCSPGTLVGVQYCICSVSAIPFYRSTTTSGARLHVSIGFETVMADCVFIRPTSEVGEGSHLAVEYEHLASLATPTLVILSFDRTVYTRLDTFYIASKLDHQGKGCRFAFHGKVLEVLENVALVKQFVRKQKNGLVDRLENSRSIICHSLFKKETKMSLFEGMSVCLSTGEVGRVESSFGKSGKARVTFASPLAPATIEALEKGQAVQNASVFVESPTAVVSCELSTYLPHVPPSLARTG